MARLLVEVNTTLDRPTTTAPPACTQTCSPVTGLVTALIQAG